MLKIAVVAPMPTASVSTATMVKVGDRRMTRSAYAESCRSCDRCSRGPVRSRPAMCLHPETQKAEPSGGGAPLRAEGMFHLAAIRGAEVFGEHQADEPAEQADISRHGGPQTVRGLRTPSLARACSSVLERRPISAIATARPSVDSR